MIEREESMVERVAKAIRDASTQDDWTRAAARAAIEAMRTPTEAMLEAVSHAEDERGYIASAYETMPASEAWPIMIDAALKQKDGGNG